MASPPLSQSPSAPSPPHLGGWHCPWGGEGRATLARTLSPVRRWWHSCLSIPQSPSLRQEGSSLFLHSVRSSVRNTPCPPPGPGVLGDQGRGHPPGLWGRAQGPGGCASLARAGGELEPWAGRRYSWGQMGRAGLAALSCCDRPAGAGQFPDGTAGRSAAAGSTAGSSRRGHS